MSASDKAHLEMKLHTVSDKLSQIAQQMKDLEAKIDTFSHDLSTIHSEIYDIRKALK